MRRLGASDLSPHSLTGPPVRLLRAAGRSSLLLLLALLALTSPLGAQDADNDEGPKVSPRAAFEGFLSSARKGRYHEAARWLDVPKSLQGSEEELARKLWTVLDRKLPIAAADVPLEARRSDGEATRHELGRIVGSSGRPEPVVLVHSGSASVPWHFSRSTVLRIDGWYQTLPEHLLLDRMPRLLLRVGPYDLMWWQWLLVPGLAAVSVAVGRGITWLFRKLLLRFTRKLRWGAALVHRFDGPAWLLASIGVAFALTPRLGLIAPAEALVHTTLKSGVILALFWAALRSIDLAADVIGSLEALQNESARSLLPLGTRFAKVAVLLMLVIAVLANFGLPVASLLAGLGVGGVAFALAAQKTVENLFGAVSIGVDRPFRVGDLVKVDDLTGVVEAIGLRSTRIRTPDRSLVTLPNAKLADSRIESLSARDRIRLKVQLSIEYASETTMRKVLESLEAALLAHPRVLKEDLAVRLVELGAYALNVEAVAWLAVQEKDLGPYRQEILLSLLGAVERSGGRLALPSQHVVLSRDEARRSAREPKSERAGS